MSRILVAGGAGFLGTSLCKALLSQGETVICVDNLLTGRRENLRDMLNVPGFSFIEQDVQQPLNIAVDQIYNLACPASPPRYQADPIETLKISVMGTLSLLELAYKYNAKILHFSTSEVYGDPEEHPQRESYRGNVNPIGPRACYDEGKRCAETLCFDFLRRYDTKIKVIRIFNTYGPHMDPEDGRVVSNFIMQALRGEDITIYGAGDQTRSFCYVDDLIAGILDMMNRSRNDFHGPVNLGNPGEFLVKELAHMVIEMTGSKSAIRHLPLPVDDPTRRCPCIDLAKEELGWEPKVSLSEGLVPTIAYFRGLLNG